MKRAITRLGLALAGAAVLLLQGCGGSGGGDPPPPTEATLTGVAATGAPFAGALVTLFDASGTVRGTTTVALDGSYSLTIPAATEAPLVLEASRDTDTLVSAFAETRSTRLNITPLTHLIAARLASDGDPLSLRADSAAVTQANLDARVAEVKRILEPLLEAIGDDTDPLTGDFSADGAGHDKVLDAVQVDIRPAGASSNIEITVRVASDEPVKTTFSSTASSPPALPDEIDAADLPPDGIAQMVADMADRLTACYAVPFAQRVRGVSGGAMAVEGTASDVLAPACRTLFLDDDPATFLNNGYRVGRNASNVGAFSSLFRSGATGVVFSDAKLELVRANQDLVFSYRTTDAQGNTGRDTLIARNVGGVLHLVGNQYVYEASVRPYAQDRDFLNQPAATYLSTGYDVFIPNRLDGSGNAVFSKVEVTAPDGAVLTYRPSGGRTAMVIAKADGSLTGSSVVRLAGRFKDAATPGNPAQHEPNLYFVSPQYSEQQIVALAEQGLWRLEFFHADATQANVVQHYRTLARAATLDEFAATPLPQMTDAAKAEVRTESSQHGVVIFGPVSASAPNRADLSAAGDTDFWTVPPRALPPTQVTIFGAGPDPDGAGPQTRVSFDDVAGVPPTARKVVITCSPSGNADNHCDNSTGVLQYAEGTVINSIQLYAIQPRFAGVARMYVTYYILPR